MLGDGFEPVEVVAPVDVLRRGGVDVTLVSVMGRKEVTSAQDIKMVADALVEDVDLDLFTMVVVPGGSVGVENLGKCDKLAESLRDRMKANKLVGSICAGPTILANLDLLQDHKAVCYPGCETNFPAGVYQPNVDVCIDKNLITATGPATALPFGRALLEALKSEKDASEVASGMLFLGLYSPFWFLSEQRRSRRCAGTSCGCRLRHDSEESSETLRERAAKQYN